MRSCLDGASTYIWSVLYLAWEWLDIDIGRREWEIIQFLSDPDLTLMTTEPELCLYWNKKKHALLLKLILWVMLFHLSANAVYYSSTCAHWYLFYHTITFPKTCQGKMYIWNQSNKGLLLRIIIWYSLLVMHQYSLAVLVLCRFAWRETKGNNASSS